jgi:hypothetical protein
MNPVPCIVHINIAEEKPWKQMNTVPVKQNVVDQKFTEIFGKLTAMTCSGEPTQNHFTSERTVGERITHN